MDFGKIVEQAIREAQAQGKFDRLAGHGQPLALDQADENAADWTANHLLKNAGFRPDWLEEDLALRAELEQARAAGRRAWAWRQTERQALGTRADPEAQLRRSWIEDEWTLARGRFRATLAGLNRRQRDLNLRVPHERFQRLWLDVDQELAALSPD